LHQLSKQPAYNCNLAALEEKVRVQAQGRMMEESQYADEHQRSRSAPITSMRVLGSGVRKRINDTGVESFEPALSSPITGMARLRLWTQLVQEAHGGKPLLQLMAESRRRSRATIPLYSRYALAACEDNYLKSSPQRCVSCHINVVVGQRL
jgi:hypothetical protein